MSIRSDLRRFFGHEETAVFDQSAPPFATPDEPVYTSRIGVNTRDNYTGPDYDLGMVDDMWFTNADVHFEVSHETSAYMIIQQGGRQVFVQFGTHELTKTERDEYRKREQTRSAPKAAIIAWIEYDTGEDNG